MRLILTLSLTLLFCQFSQAFSYRSNIQSVGIINISANYRVAIESNHNISIGRAVQLPSKAMQSTSYMSCPENVELTCYEDFVNFPFF